MATARVKAFIHAIKVVMEQSGNFGTIDVREQKYGPIETYEIFLEVRRDSQSEEWDKVAERLVRDQP